MTSPRSTSILRIVQPILLQDDFLRPQGLPGQVQVRVEGVAVIACDGQNKNETQEENNGVYCTFEVRQSGRDAVVRSVSPPHALAQLLGGQVHRSGGTHEVLVGAGQRLQPEQKANKVRNQSHVSIRRQPVGRVDGEVGNSVNRIIGSSLMEVVDGVLLALLDRVLAAAAKSVDLTLHLGPVVVNARTLAFAKKMDSKFCLPLLFTSDDDVILSSAPVRGRLRASHHRFAFSEKTQK